MIGGLTTARSCLWRLTQAALYRSLERLRLARQSVLVEPHHLIEFALPVRAKRPRAGIPYLRRRLVIAPLMVQRTTGAREKFFSGGNTERPSTSFLKRRVAV
jgi:hypothetical protein